MTYRDLATVLLSAGLLLASPTLIAAVGAGASAGVDATADVTAHERDADWTHYGSPPRGGGIG